MALPKAVSSGRCRAPLVRRIASQTGRASAGEPVVGRAAHGQRQANPSLLVLVQRMSPSRMAEPRPAMAGRRTF